MCMSSVQLTNQIIAGLPDEALQRWLPRLERVTLPQGLTLHESGCQMSYAYFPTTAVVSIIYEAADGASMELAVVGNEGIVGIEFVLGGGSMPNRAVVETAGEAFRLPAWVVQDEVARAGSATDLLLRYTMSLIAQVAQIAACNRHHSLHQRLCRWLLMCLDRVQGDEIVATQEQVAGLLGVRREGVTEAAHHLQTLGLIRYSRGRILVRDRRGIESQACECYSAVKREHNRLLLDAISASRQIPSSAVASDHTTALNNVPTPAVIAIASAPQNPTRHAPAKTPAPPAWAATAPSRARNARDVPEIHAIAPLPGANAATANGRSAPTAKLAAEAKAA